MAQVRYGITQLSELPEKLEEPLRELWNERQALWASNWEKVVALAQTNQQFIQHSLKNLSTLLDNLKQLFGKQSLYDQSGRPKDMNQSGKVTEGRY